MPVPVTVPFTAATSTPGVAADILPETPITLLEEDELTPSIAAAVPWLVTENRLVEFD
jgi:hypothetical protein